MPLAVNWPFSPVGQFSLPWTIASRITMASVGLTAKIFTNLLNSSTVHNSEVLYDAIEKRPANQPLITCSNHHSCLDEPLLWGMLKWRHHSYGNHVMRWATGASDVCFKKELHSKFFALGRTIPLVRGDGVYQKSMDFAVDVLNTGAWVHIYPEGKINEKKNPMRLKWGIGRLISDCKIPPIVIPFWHLGMDDVLPNKRPYRLKMFKKITTLIGDPIDLNGTMEELNRTNASNKRESDPERTASGNGKASGNGRANVSGNGTATGNGKTTGSGKVTESGKGSGKATGSGKTGKRTGVGKQVGKETGEKETNIRKTSKKPGQRRITRRKAFTDIIQSTFLDLEARTKQLHYGNSETVS